MKLRPHTLILLITTFCASQNIYSQEERSHFEFTTGYGFRSSDQLFDGYGSYYSGYGKYSYSTDRYTGPISFSAKYFSAAAIRKPALCN